MRGFLGTAAAMIFIFSLLTAMYSFTIIEPDLSASSRAGMAVEMSRWAVEADLDGCANENFTSISEVQNWPYDGTIFADSMGITNYSVSGNRTVVNNFQAGMVSISLDFEYDYHPKAFIFENIAIKNIKFGVCDEWNSHYNFTLYDADTKEIICSTEVGAPQDCDGNDAFYRRFDVQKVDHSNIYAKIRDPYDRISYSRVIEVKK